VLLRGDAAALAGRLPRHGLRMTRGGRFLTAIGRHDKGTAVRAFLQGRSAQSWAVGDAPNDGPMLAAVEHPYLVRRPDGSWTSLDVAGVTRVRGIGPAGFVEVAQRLLVDLPAGRGGEPAIVGRAPRAPASPT
jgi:predicted mannosyl-3-phosphoglycerate phosphatase (HAD superfamily)